MLRQGKMKHNKEQFEYPKSIVIPRCEGEYPHSYYHRLSIKVMHELMSELDAVCLNDNEKNLLVLHYLNLSKLTAN